MLGTQSRGSDLTYGFDPKIPKTQNLSIFPGRDTQVLFRSSIGMPAPGTCSREENHAKLHLKIMVTILEIISDLCIYNYINYRFKHINNQHI